MSHATDLLLAFYLKHCEVLNKKMQIGFEALF